jgi:L-alanine-DL-glutamate epimerase-like enolase superfamily enzyme
MPNPHRRRFLQIAGLAGAAAFACSEQVFPASYAKLAPSAQRKIEITDVKCMIVRGTWHWNLIKLETDSGLYGIGEAYWGSGVKDLVVNKIRSIVVGEDPLDVDRL